LSGFATYQALATVCRSGQLFSGYKGTASSKGILMKRSAPLMLGLLLVLGIAFLCLTIGTRYPESVRRAREAVLKNDLAYMRKSIDDFTRDRQQAPQSLQDPVDGNYLRVIPTDPLTHKKNWVPHFGTVRLGNGRTTFGIDNVHSGSEHADW
jgi:general secretion pathway protein G